MNYLKELKNELLIVANVWDVESAKTAERLGFKVIGTSSGVIAKMLRYEDGENMSFSELEYTVKRIISSIKVALSVDLETGYATEAEKIVENIKRLADLGIIGINIEDSNISNNRTLRDG